MKEKDLNRIHSNGLADAEWTKIRVCTVANETQSMACQSSILSS